MAPGSCGVDGLGSGSTCVIRRLVPPVLALLLAAGCGSSAASPAAVRQGAPSPTPDSVASGPATSPGGPAAVGVEDVAMAAAAPASKLQQIVQGLTAQYGAFGSVGNAATTAGASGTLVDVPVMFASAVVTLEVALDGVGRVAGLHVVKVVPVPGASPAAYVKPGSFTETAVTVGSAPWTLPGTLTMPNGAGPFPAVVLVAGSGPADRNESFGPNKPFEDLAWGLASAGIAVLRYDKRTLVYGKQMAADASITVRQETTDDAEAGVTLLRETPKIDPARVFLVGHSLGAYLGPRIAAEIPGELVGIAMLEAPSTPLPDLIVIQERYLATLGGGSPSPQVEQQLATLEKQAALADSPGLSPATPASQLPLDTPAAYWIDLQTYHPLTVAAGLGIPMFFSQGGRDYQVPPSQLSPWQQALAGHSNVTFRTYPAMDHLLLDGAGPATPAEYSVPGHVDPQLVSDLAAWVEGR